MNSLLPSSTFKNLGDEKLIQEKLGIAIMTDFKFAMQMVDILDVKYFDLIYVRVVMEEYMNYYKEYKHFPTHDLLYEIVKNKLEVISNENLLLFINDFFNSLRDGDKVINDPDMPFVKDKALDFCKKQKVLNAMIQAQTMLNNSKFDEVASLLNTALQAGSEREIGLIYDEDIQTRVEELINREPVSSGYEHLDNLIRGGFGRGELIIFIAPTGGGKTTFMINLGVNALKMGKKVVYYTLELDKSIIGLRYDANILNIPLEDFIEPGEAIYDSEGHIKEVKKVKPYIMGELIGMKDKGYIHKDSKLVIKQFLSRRATVNTIRNHLFKMNIMNMKPDLIIVDYADILKPLEKRSELRHELMDICGDLKALAQEYRCPVITASQTNRSGWDEEFVTLKHIAESYAKVNEVDLALCFSRTTLDKSRGTARMSVAKNRNGKEGLVFPVKYTDSIYKIEVLQSCNYDELPKEFMISERKQMQSIIKKYSEDYGEERNQ